MGSACPSVCSLWPHYRSLRSSNAGTSSKSNQLRDFTGMRGQVTALLAVAVAVYVCFRRLAAGNRIETPPQA